MLVRISKVMRKHLRQIAALHKLYALVSATPRSWHLSVQYQKALREIKRARAKKNDRR